MRGDFEQALRERGAALALARELGRHRQAEASETSIIYALNQLARHGQAAERALALLAAIEEQPHSDANSNAAHAYRGLLEALICQAHPAASGCATSVVSPTQVPALLSQAQASAARAWAACTRDDFASALVPPLCLLAALQSRRIPARRTPQGEGAFQR